VKPAITLIELLVVIALVGIIAGTGWPALTGWNCKQELRNDFESLNQLFEKARSEAINRSQTVLVRANRSLPSNGATYTAYLLTNKACTLSGSAQSLDPMIPKLVITSKSRLLGVTNQCFNSDGTASASNSTQLHQVQRDCGKGDETYQTLVFGATGLFEKKVRRPSGSSFEDL
jgi:prepilin-type N-terminal cleavage/methylation domain-containing protein